jgi:hypothetical protein
MHCETKTEHTCICVTRAGLGLYSATAHLEEPCCAQLQCAWDKLTKHATGPFQLWATCDPKHAVYSLVFISTCFNAWINYARKCEDKVLFGAIACRFQGDLVFFRVLRYGKDITNEQRKNAETQKIIPFEEIFDEAVDEIILAPDGEREDVARYIGEKLGCPPREIRL